MQMLEQRDEWSSVKPGGGAPDGVSMVRPGQVIDIQGRRPQFDLEKNQKIRAPSWSFLLAAEEVQGPILKLWKVSRMDMGAYMCIAR